MDMTTSYSEMSQQDGPQLCLWSPECWIYSRYEFMKNQSNTSSVISSQAIIDITNDSEFNDLEKFQLDDDDWKLLKDYKRILRVWIYVYNNIY